MQRLSAAHARLVATAIALLPALALAAPEDLQPGPNLRVENIPPIPHALVAKIGAYTEFRGHRLLDWNPERREMLVARRAQQTMQVFRLAEPGAAAQQLTDFTEPVANASFPPARGDYFVFGRDEGGNERFRLFRFDLATRTATPLSDPTRRASGGTWAKRGEQFFYTLVPVGQRLESSELATEIRTLNPREPASDRAVAKLPGVGWSVSDLSPDERTLAVTQSVSVGESYLWTIDIASGNRRLLTQRRDGEPVRYGLGAFAADGRSLYATSDRASEFRRLVAIDLATREERVVAAHAWDVTYFVLSDDGKRIAYVTNEDGASVLRVIDAASTTPLEMPALPRGVIGGLAWRNDQRTLGVTLSSSTDPAAVYAVDVTSGRVERWSPRDATAIDTRTFPEPELVRWRSFDGRTISGYLVAPPASFAGRRPVMIDIHGGPESQWRPSFMGRNNFYTRELGIAVLYPNVRGSTGYGKSFVRLDDGRQREHSVRDIGALLDWIREQPRLDAGRVMVAGVSYGGYMSLATAAMYPERIACAISNVGITNFVSFLQNTAAYRRDLRRVEYGDERDPAMRKFLEDISPLANAHRIKRPLFVVHGENDPRVPVSEARSLLATLKKNGTPVWSLIAADEGHGFARSANADYLFYASVLFARDCLGLDPK